MPPSPKRQKTDNGDGNPFIAVKKSQAEEEYELYKKQSRERTEAVNWVLEEGKKAKWIVEGKFLEALTEYAKFEKAKPDEPVRVNDQWLTGGHGIVESKQLIICADQNEYEKLSKNQKANAVITGSVLTGETGKNIKQKLRNRGTAQEHRLKMRTEALFVPKVINQYEHLTGQFAQLLEEELSTQMLAFDPNDEVLDAIFDECNN